MDTKIMVHNMYNTFIEFVQTLGQSKEPEKLIALGIFSANLTERFCQNNAVQLTFKVTLQTKLFIKMREVISIHVGQAGCQMGKLEIFGSYKSMNPRM